MNGIPRISERESHFTHIYVHTCTLTSILLFVRPYYWAQRGTADLILQVTRWRSKWFRNPRLFRVTARDYLSNGEFRWRVSNGANPNRADPCSYLIGRFALPPRSLLFVPHPRATAVPTSRALEIIHERENHVKRQTRVWADRTHRKSVLEFFILRKFKFHRSFTKQSFFRYPVVNTIQFLYARSQTRSITFIV